MPFKDLQLAVMSAKDLQLIQESTQDLQLVSETADPHAIQRTPVGRNVS